MESDKAQSLLLRIANVSFLVGIVLAGMGILLVYMGAKGETEFTFFGQSFRSTNVGIASIFLGAALIVLNLRKILSTFEKTIPHQEGRKVPGNLRIDNIKVTQEKLPNRFEDLQPAKCLVDFWVTNDGGTQIVVTGIDLEVIDAARCELVKGHMESSKTYDVDIVDLREPGQVSRFSLSQMIKPGESDRFTIVLVASELGLGVFAAWKLLPTLITNYGSVKGEAIEVWLPYLDPGTTFKEMKDFQATERSLGIRR